MKLWIKLEKQIRDETNTLTTWLVQIKVIKMPQIMDVCPCALQAQEHGIYPISAEGWQIAYTCMTPVQDMNGLEGGPATVVSSRLVGHAHLYVFIPYRLHTTRVRGRGGGECFTCKPASTNGCGHWVWYVRRALFLGGDGCRAVWKPQSVNEQWGGQSDRQWSEISRWKPWGWLVEERLIHQSLQTAYVTCDAKVMKAAQWWLKNL